ncbi:thioredoxin [Verrucomicrobiota bacterium]
MAENIVELNEADFDAAIAEGVTLVDFWAPWCGPCKMQLPILESVAGKVEGATIAKVNVDENAPVAAKFGVRSIPTLVIFKDGEAVKQFTGLQQENALVEAVNAAK